MSCATGGENVLCLTACSLGCRGTTCEVTEIAQNENIVLRFNKDIDPHWATPSTIQFRTSSGEQPVGDFLVNGPVVEFVPQILVVGGQTFFGFRAGESYTMTLPGGPNEPNALRSTSGDPLRETVSCALNVSRGIIDLNGVPPAAHMISPTQVTNVPQDVVIQLEFNELIDITPFIGATGANSPIIFAARRTRDVNGVRECNPNSQPVPLGGAPRVTADPVRAVSIVTFQPTSLLPGNICVDITVTDRVRDLSGKPAQPQTFQFITVPTQLTEQSILEEFDDDTNLDRDASAGAWGVSHGTAPNETFVAQFGLIGGDGRHGKFDPALGHDDGVINGRRTFTFNTDNTIIPGANTTSGNSIAVTDGKFFFDEMEVPADVRLRFVGNSPPQFTVRGKIQFDGLVEMEGADTIYYVPSSSTVTAGQPGGAGGIFAGSGGKGGDRCAGIGASPSFNGQDGGDVRVLGGHAFAGQVAGTGGRGSQLFPASGLSTALIYPPGFTIAYCSMSAAGGGGGGLLVPGGNGHVVSNNIPDPISGVPPRLDFMGPPAAGGIALPLFPVPGGTQSSIHFLVGGSGGGGAGSHALFAINLARSWAPGCGGGGGGGAMSLRAGDTLRISQNAQILAAGGSCGSSPTTAASQPQAAPAGGGSGGTVLLQAGRIADVTGFIDVRGGLKGVLNRSSPSAPPAGGTINVEGGNGSDGLVRLEAPGTPGIAMLPNVQPPATAQNVATLTESDTRTGFRSVFLSTQQAFGPEFVRYEIRAWVDNNLVVFSDDAAVGQPALAGLAPIEAFFQAATIDLSTGQVDPNTLRPWRTAVGSFGGNPSLADDALNAFRFMLVLDRTFGQDVQIESVKVIFRV